jgi:hypothetical protein
MKMIKLPATLLEFKEPTLLTQEMVDEAIEKMKVSCDLAEDGLPYFPTFILESDGD